MATCWGAMAVTVRVSGTCRPPRWTMTVTCWVTGTNWVCHKVSWPSLKATTARVGGADEGGFGSSAGGGLTAQRAARAASVVRNMSVTPAGRSEVSQRSDFTEPRRPPRAVSPAERHDPDHQPRADFRQSVSLEETILPRPSSYPSGAIHSDSPGARAEGQTGKSLIIAPT